ncbi:hypothetical protein RIF29_25195 [Crotalaria pallida]|uniref:Uncharacterized protein n=1 Tax=Crotalaria pallida TaxID=3830 RepID=A0AAN9I3Z3_CROPI
MAKPRLLTPRAPGKVPPPNQTPTSDGHIGSSMRKRFASSAGGPPKSTEGVFVGAHTRVDFITSMADELTSSKKFELRLLNVELEVTPSPTEFVRASLDLFNASKELEDTLAEVKFVGNLIATLQSKNNSLEKQVSDLQSKINLANKAKDMDNISFEDMTTCTYFDL